MKHKYGITALSLIVLQLLIVLGSWLVTAVFPEVSVNSLLSGSGIRWFIGQFTNNLKTDLLVWMLLCSVSVGVFKSSGLSSALVSLIKGTTQFSKFSYRSRVALRLVLFEFVFCCCLFSLFIVLPEAPLLSVTGSLFPSSFSVGIIPSMTFIVTFVSLSYGIACGTLHSVAEMYDAFSSGLILYGKFFPLYIFAVELFYSIIYVFNIKIVF